jgi:hypothetical protein
MPVPPNLLNEVPSAELSAGALRDLLAELHEALDALHEFAEPEPLSR